MKALTSLSKRSSHKIRRVPVWIGQRREYFSCSLEGAPTVHRDKIVDEHGIALLPGQIKRDFVSQLGRNIHRIAIERRAIAKANCFRRIVAIVLPPLERG